MKKRNGHSLTESSISVLCARSASISTFFGRTRLPDLLAINPALDKMRSEGVDAAGMQQSSGFATRARLGYLPWAFSTTPMVQSQLWFCPADSLLPPDSAETSCCSCAACNFWIGLVSSGIIQKRQLLKMRVYCSCNVYTSLLFMSLSVMVR